MTDDDPPRTVAEDLTAGLAEFAADLEAGIDIGKKYTVRRLKCDCWDYPNRPCEVHPGGPTPVEAP